MQFKSQIKRRRLSLDKIRKMSRVFRSEKAFDAACQDFESNVAGNKFGVLHIHDVKDTLSKKGISLDKNCKIYEICNPVRAKHLLDMDFKLIMGLPCRVAIWESEGGVEIGMTDAQSVLGMIDSNPEVISYATEVNDIIVAIVNATI